MPRDPAPPTNASATVAALSRPRQCWVLCEDMDTGEWSVDEDERREAIAIAAAPPLWDGKRWQPHPVAPAIFLTWAPDDGGQVLWIDANYLFWSKAIAQRAAEEHTRHARLRTYVEPTASASGSSDAQRTTAP